MCALALGILVAPLTKTIVALCHLHPLVEVDLPLFVNNFHPKMDLVLDLKTFIYALTHFPPSFIWWSFRYGVCFCGIVLSLMILLVASIYFLRYVGTLLVVMFFH
jgi:hypothetical protein